LFVRFIGQRPESQTARVLATLAAKEMPHARQEQDATPEIGQYVLRLPKNGSANFNRHRAGAHLSRLAALCP
jgi:hypothetical protein